ncbi:MAG: alpha/beta hydrolase [Clostridia bacterium]
MIYWIIVIFASTLIITFIRYVKLGRGVSFLGFIVRNVVGTTTYLFRNHTQEITKQYKELNKITEWKVKEGNFRWYSVKNYNIESLQASMLTPKSAKSGKVLLQLHGGGYEIDLPYNNLYFAKKYAKLLKYAEVLTINYRVAPKDKYPAALEDSVKAYKWLLSNGYSAKNIIIVGDSAGGGLAIATVLYLRDNNIQLPKAVVTMSAWSDLTNSQASFKQNYKRDPVFGNSSQSIIYTSTYAEGMNKKEPYISPLYGDFTGFPDLLMQVGTHEILLHDTIELAIAAKKAGVLVSVDVYKGMFHIFQKYKGFLPEADSAWKSVKQFINKEYSENIK